MERRIEVHMVEVEGNKTNPQIIIVQGRTCHILWRFEVRSNRKAPQGGCNLRKSLKHVPTMLLILTQCGGIETGLGSQFESI